jgi:hypothetical protein
VCLILCLLVLSSTRMQSAAAQDAPSFARHVVPLLSRLGCNAGSCHGAVQGQNGFRLSLFGADPAADHEQVRRAEAGRRVNLLSSEDSLVLLKARGAIPHGGGQVTRADSPEYAVLSRWVAAGALLDSVDDGRVVSLKVTPPQQTAKTGDAYQLKVEAEFAGGVVEDVTHLCSFESKAGGIAEVDRDGEVTAVSAGSTAILIRFGSEPVIAMIEVARLERIADEIFAVARPFNTLDERILAKLKRLNLAPAGLIDDAGFLRRVRLDITGQLPTPDEVVAFLADSAPDKRSKKIDQLLDESGYAALWALKFCDLLGAADFGVYADGLKKEQDAPRFQAWVRARLEENTPYDEFAARILTATSREGRSLEEWSDEVVALQAGYKTPRTDLEVYAKRRTLDAYWQRKGAIGVSGTLQLAHAFLGLRLECAQCHRHPHDVWQQDDLLSFANFFMRVRKVGFNGQNEKKYPEEGKLFKQFNDEGKKLAEEVKKLKAGKGKTSADTAKKAQQDANRLRGELNRAEQQIATFEQQAKNLTEQRDALPADQKQQRDALTQKIEQAAAKVTEQRQVADEKRNQLAPLDKVIAENAKLQKEISELERRSKYLPGEVAKRILHAQIHILNEEQAPKAFASVTSPLGTQTSETFRLLGETEPVSIKPDEDPRQKVVEWLRRPDNPFFTRAIVNRVWAHYFGRGIVDPPDNLSPFNPPSHPQLLDDLCSGFVSNGYDLKWLHRMILNSRTYQQTSLTDSRSDPASYAAFPLRRLPAEVLLDALNQATGTTENLDMRYYHWPEEMRTVEIPYMPRNSFVAFMLEQFGRPDRNSSIQCDCERQSDASMLQVLSFANHPRVWKKIEDPAGLVANVVKETSEPRQQIERLYLSSVSRPPLESERVACLDYLKQSETPEKGLQGILWGLINTKEFILQH